MVIVLRCNVSNSFEYLILYKNRFTIFSIINLVCYDHSISYISLDVYFEFLLVLNACILDKIY